MVVDNGAVETSTSWLHRDGLSTVRGVTGSDGLMDERATYRPFGEAVSVDANPNAKNESKGWIGERYDADAGLQYLNARYYDPKLGMFLQPDWWEVTEPGVGTNRYSYAFNDPIGASDPSGHEVEDGTDTDEETEQRETNTEELAKKKTIAKFNTNFGGITNLSALKESLAGEAFSSTIRVIRATGAALPGVEVSATPIGEYFSDSPGFYPDEVARPDNFTEKILKGGLDGTTGLGTAEYDPAEDTITYSITYNGGVGYANMTQDDYDKLSSLGINPPENAGAVASIQAEIRIRRSGLFVDARVTFPVDLSFLKGDW